MACGWLVGALLVLCLATAAVACPALTAPTHGSQSGTCSSSSGLNSQCTQTCDDGYYDSNTNGASVTRTCNILGAWNTSPASPNCVASLCPAITPGTNEVVGTCTANGNQGATCLQDCQAAYGYPGGRTTGTCAPVSGSINAAWQGQTISCVLVTCAAPTGLGPSVTVGTCTAGTTPTTTCNLACVTGAVGSGNSPGTCTRTGQTAAFSGQALTCTPSTCSPTLTIGNGTVTGSCTAPVAQGGVCSPQCNPGYVLGGGDRTCLAGPGSAASWSGSAFTCTASKCSTPSLPSNSVTVSCSAAGDFGAVCRVQCTSMYINNNGGVLNNTCAPVGTSSSAAYQPAFSFSCYLCPGTGTQCTSHGTCYDSGSAASCNCTNGWAQPGCSTLICPGDLTRGPCSGNGTCIESTAVCKCSSAFYGSSCLVLAPIISTMTELIGPVAGNATRVEITGTRFNAVHQANGSVICQFRLANGQAYNATFVVVNATYAYCMPPAVPAAGNYNLTIMGNVALASRVYQYYDLPVFVARTPASGIYTGGTNLTMTILNYLSGPLSACVIAGQFTSATSLGGSLVSCMTPPDTLPSGANREEVIIGITYNRREIYYANSTLIFTYTVPAQVTFFTPSNLPGGQNVSTLIYIVGPYFFFDPATPTSLVVRLCHAANCTYIVATYISTAVLTVVFPPFPAQSMTVQVTANLQEWSAPQVFLYYGVPTKLLVQGDTFRQTNNVAVANLLFSVSLTDSSNNLADPDTAYTLQATITPTPIRMDGSPLATSVRSVAGFTFSFKGWPNTNYSIVFTVISGGSAGVVISDSAPVIVRVMTCAEALPGSIANVADNATCACPAGSEWVTSPSAMCVECGPGTASGAPSTAAGVTCLPCLVGQYANGTGLTTCTPCDAGFQGPSQGLSTCLPCDQGKFSVQGSSFCLSCAPGSVSQQGSATCTQCLAGFFASQTGYPCIQCADGTVAPPGTAAGGCVPCRAGTFAVGAAATCTDCRNGTTSSAPFTSCYDCPAGKYAPQTGMAACLTCGTGTISPGGTDSCTACPSGTIADSLHIYCLTCLPGFTSAGAGTACVPCGAGTAQNNVTLMCDPCPEGTYSGAAATTCLPCIAGTFAPSDTTAACTPCAPGKHTNGSTGLTECLDCGPGTFSGRGAATCSPCGVGFASNATGVAQCEPCDAGHYADYLGATACSPCPPATFSATIQASTCTPCSDGFIAATPGSSECSECPAGAYASSGIACPCLEGYGYIACAGTCVPCGEGAYCPGGFASPTAMAGFFRRGGYLNTSDCSAGPGQLTTEVNSFIKCVPATACSGGERSDCREGYEGDRCATCTWDRSNDTSRYYRFSSGCAHCLPGSMYWLWIALFFAFVIVCVILLIASPKVQVNSLAKQTVEASPIAAFSILVANYQVLSLIGNMGLTWTTTSKGVFGFLTVLALNPDGLPGCAIHIAAEYIIVYKMFIPLGAIIVFALIYFVVYIVAGTIPATNRTRWAEVVRFLNSRERFIGVYISFLNLLYTTLASAVFSAFNCTELSDGTFVNESYPDYLCYDARWYRTLLPASIAGAVIYVVGFPLFAIVVLTRFRTKLSVVRFRLKFGVLYAMYDPKFFWWVIPLKSYKLGVALAVSVVSQNPYVRAACAAVVIGLYSAACIYANPYSHPPLNYVNIYGCLVTVMTIVVAAVSQGTTGLPGLAAAGIVVAMVAAYSAYAFFVLIQLLRRKAHNLHIWGYLKSNIGNFRPKQTRSTPHSGPHSPGDVTPVNASGVSLIVDNRGGATTPTNEVELMTVQEEEMRSPSIRSLPLPRIPPRQSNSSPRISNLDAPVANIQQVLDASIEIEAAPTRVVDPTRPESSPDNSSGNTPPGSPAPLLASAEHRSPSRVNLPAINRNRSVGAQLPASPDNQKRMLPLPSESWLEAHKASGKAPATAAAAPATTTASAPASGTVGLRALVLGGTSSGGSEASAPAAVGGKGSRTSSAGPSPVLPKTAVNKAARPGSTALETIPSGESIAAPSSATQLDKSFAMLGDSPANIAKDLNAAAGGPPLKRPALHNSRMSNARLTTTSSDPSSLRSQVKMNRVNSGSSSLFSAALDRSRSAESGDSSVAPAPPVVVTTEDSPDHTTLQAPMEASLGNTRGSSMESSHEDSPTPLPIAAPSAASASGTSPQGRGLRAQVSRPPSAATSRPTTASSTGGGGAGGALALEGTNGSTVSAAESTAARGRRKSLTNHGPVFTAGTSPFISRTKSSAN